MKEKGQISIMVAVMMLTFLMLFAFVINTGMLVNAKINLQNAADMAAYSGASVQARQLTQISYLNYEMRRQWKKLLFRLYVVGTMSQDGFPRDGGPNAPMIYKPDGRGSVVYPAPATCIVFNATDNYCRLPTLPSITIPPESGLDSITDTLRGQLLAIENIRARNCQSVGQTNKMLNIYWLFNPDPTTQALSAGLATDQSNTLKLIQGMILGLGIVPREILLNFRIKTLAGYVNTPPLQSVGLERAQNLLQSVDPPANERTVQAFFSAYYTLGNWTFSGDSIELDELMAPNLLNLKTIAMQKIDTMTIDLQSGGQAAGVGPSGPADCNAVLLPVSVNPGLPVGVYKDPTVFTYYAIRVRAEANILFSPFGPVKLKAYSAAHPFGSRIGPSQADFVGTFSVPASPSAPAGTMNIPNLPLKTNDSASQGNGWDNQYVLGLMYAALAGTNGQILGVDSAALGRAYHHAMAPNPWEVNKYNIINDAGSDHFIRNFDTKGYTAFWAPVFPPNKMAGASDQIAAAVNQLFAVPTGNVSFTAGAGSLLGGILAQGLNQYITGALSQGMGEDGEGMNIVRIQNPLISPEGVTVNSDGESSAQTIATNPKQIKTSWNDVNDSNLRDEGRTGYSVKFVSFNNLTTQKLSTNGQSSWNNTLNMYEDVATDIPYIQH